MCRICFAHEPEISITFGRKSKKKKKKVIYIPMYYLKTTTAC